MQLFLEIYSAHWGFGEKFQPFQLNIIFNMKCNCYLVSYMQFLLLICNGLLQLCLTFILFAVCSIMHSRGQFTQIGDLQRLCSGSEINVTLLSIISHCNFPSHIRKKLNLSSNYLASLISLFKAASFSSLL